MKKRILIILVVLFVIIQFFRPEKNSSGMETYAVNTRYAMPDTVAVLLDNACSNCHSNKTDYPWYASIQPVGWWLGNHINEGKQHLNLSEFARGRVAFQNHHFDEIIEQVKEKEMPLPSYTWLGLHSEARLSDDQRVLLVTWAQAQMDTLKAHYPADSLVMPRRGPRPPQED